MNLTTIETEIQKTFPGATVTCVPGMDAIDVTHEGVGVRIAGPDLVMMNGAEIVTLLKSEKARQNFGWSTEAGQVLTSLADSVIAEAAQTSLTERVVRALLKKGYSISALQVASPTGDFVTASPSTFADLLGVK